MSQEIQMFHLEIDYFSNNMITVFIHMFLINLQWYRKIYTYAIVTFVFVEVSSLNLTSLFTAFKKL